MTRRPDALLALLHMCDSMFPTGAFAYSEGLEPAAANGLVTRADDLREWLEVCRDEGFARSDGPSMALAWSAIATADWRSLETIDREAIALRPSSTSRASNRSMGRRLATTWQGLHPDGRLERLLMLAREERLAPALPVAFAVVGYCAGIDLRDALAGYAYTRLAATSSAAMRLVAIGQTEAHRLLSRALGGVPAAIDDLLRRNAPPESFAPALDIAQMTPQYVTSRLFRS